MPPNLDDLIQKIKIRPMHGGDFNFVINSWLKSFKYSGPMVVRMTDSLYYKAYEPIVKRLITGSNVYIACLRDEPDALVGYLVIEQGLGPDIIHYVLVKDLWQKMGVATYLIKAAEPAPDSLFTHWTNPMNSLINKVTYKYQPFLTGGDHGRTKEGATRI